MVMFGFFALVLVSIFWINKAVRMFDRLVGDGQPAWVFLEFTALTLPGVIGVVLPHRRLRRGGLRHQPAEHRARTDGDAGHRLFARRLAGRC